MINSVLLFFLIVFSISHGELETKSFKVQLQQSGSWSPDEWIEYNGKIPQLNEFAACHWEMLRYFARWSSSIWAYCFVPSEDTTQFHCIQLEGHGDLASAN